MIKLFFLFIISCASFETEKISSPEKLVFTPLKLDSNQTKFKESFEEISYEFSELNFELPFNEELKSEIKNLWRNDKFKEKKNASILIETILIPDKEEFLIKQILKLKKTNKIFYELNFKLKFNNYKQEEVFYFYQKKDNVYPLNQFKLSKIEINPILKKNEIISILEKSIYIDVDFLSIEPETEIYLDSQKIGKTPIFNYKLKKGYHKISAKRKGEKEIAETVLLQNEKTILEFGKENDSILEILSFPKNEKIIINYEKSILTNHIELNLKSGKNILEFFKENAKIFEMDFELKKNEVKKILYIVNEKNLFNIGKENFYYSKEPLSFDERLIMDKNEQIIETGWIVPMNQIIQLNLFSPNELNSSIINFTLFNLNEFISIRYLKNKIQFFDKEKIIKQIGLKNSEDDILIRIALKESQVIFYYGNGEILKFNFSQKEFYKIQIKSDSKDENYSKALKRLSIEAL